MSARQIFSNATILYFLHKEIIKRNPELNNRFVFVEDLSTDSLIKKYRSLDNIKDKEEFYKNKDPIFGFTRSVSKRFDELKFRNIFKITLGESDIDSFDQEFRDYFYNGQTENKNIRVNLTAAMIEFPYKFILLNSDIDVMDQYEQAYLNNVFLSDIETFAIDSKEIGLGPSFNLPYSLIWEDLEELKINSEGMVYNALTGNCRIMGVLLYSDGLPSYIINKINLRIFEKTSLILLDQMSIPE